MLEIFVRSGFKPCGVYVDVNLTSIKTKDNKIIM